MIRNVGLLIGNRRTVDIFKQCLIAFPCGQFGRFHNSKHMLSIINIGYAHSFDQIFKNDCLAI